MSHLSYQRIDARSQNVLDVVEEGASVGFVPPLAKTEAEANWRRDVCCSFQPAAGTGLNWVVDSNGERNATMIHDVEVEEKGHFTCRNFDANT